MKKTEVKTFAIPNELCRKTGIAVSWQPINNFGVFAYDRETLDKASNFAPTEASVFQIRQEVVLFHPIIRKLVNESNGIFIRLQEVTNNQNTDYKNELIKLSRQYRSIIRACLENLQEEITKTKNNQTEEELQNYITIFYSVECVWHLCEILFVDSLPGNLVLSHLLDWIRFHFPKHERNAAILSAGDVVGLESNPLFWDTVIGSLIQGRVKVARALLRLHSASDADVYRLADETLKSMPLYNIHTGVSVTEFKLQWRQWMDDTKAKINGQMFLVEPKLDLIMKLIVGDEATWIGLQNRCDSWYEFLAGYLFYIEPAIKCFELGGHAKRVIASMNLRSKMNHLDKVLMAAMEFDILSVIKEIQHMTENGWFVTHLTDLLFHSGRLQKAGEDIENFSAETLREAFIVDYGTLLMGHVSLWQVGIGYLDVCPNDGLNVIELLLPRIPLTSEQKTQKIVKEAQIRNLPSVVQTVCKIQAVSSLKRKRLGNALTWALKSQDDTFTSYLADKFLKQYSDNGEFSGTDILDNLGSCMLASDRLIFLGKYYEFHKLYQASEYKEAAMLLVSLLISKIIPNYFWYILLLDAIPLLECEVMVFTSNDTYTILQSLEEKIDLPELKDKVNLLRLAAARNLARALVFEAQYA